MKLYSKGSLQDRRRSYHYCVCQHSTQTKTNVRYI